MFVPRPNGRWSPVSPCYLTSSDASPRYADFAEPEADERHQLVSLVAAGLHPVVRSLATGTHYGSEGAWPLIPGSDAVARTADGALVYTGFTAHPYGTFAEILSVPFVLPLPEGADPVQIAAAINPGLSSWLPLRERAAAGPLGTVLILGATGIAGSLAVQNAITLGATQIISVGRPSERLDRLAGEENTIVALAGDETAGVGALTAAIADHRPSLILDFLWGKPAESMFLTLGRRGLRQDSTPLDYIEIGQSAGPVAAVPAALLRSTAITVRGSGAGASSMGQILAEIPVFMSRIADGTVLTPVTTCPLARVADEWNDTTTASRVVITA